MFNPNDAYAAALVVMALTLGAVVYPEESAFRPRVAGGARGRGLGLDGRRQCGEDARDRLAGLGAGRGPRRWHLCLVRLGVLSGQRLLAAISRIFAIVFALFGGVATISGPIVGVIILYGIYNLIGFTTPQYFQLIYGLLIMGLVLFLPAGLVSLATRRGWHVP